MKRIAAVTLGLALLCSAARAEFMQAPRDVPIDRLRQNVEAYLAKNPDDPQAYYVLGRLYSIAYARESDRFDDVFMGQEGELPTPANHSFETFLPEAREAWRDETRRQLATLGKTELPPEDAARIEELLAALDSDEYSVRSRAQDALVAMGPPAVAPLRKSLEREGLSAEQRGRIEAVVRQIESSLFGANCLREAIDWYGRALEKDAGHHLSRLGLGWALEEAGRTEEAIDAYRKAHLGAAEAELGREEFSHMAGGWHESIAYEAGRSLLELLPEDAEDRARIEENVEKLEKKIEQAGQWITPLVVPLREARTLEDLVDDTRSVRFDLAGNQAPRAIEWLRPPAGLLVWDPTGAGKIESGRQLFGSVTWAVFWRHGYEPLALLDDDADGWIAGPERLGLAIWQDADADAVSDPGEVRPLEDWGIEALACRSEDGACALEGVRFADGTLRPTWDWIPRERR